MQYLVELTILIIVKISTSSAGLGGIWEMYINNEVWMLVSEYVTWHLLKLGVFKCGGLKTGDLKAGYVLYV